MIKRDKRRSAHINIRKTLSLGTIAIFFAFLVYFSLGIIFVIFGQVNADEGWYLYASRLVYEGQIPYQDFAYTQTPLLPYVYGIVYKFISPSLYAGRITTFLLTTIALFLSLHVSWRYEKKRALIITLWLWVTFSYGIYYHAITKTYALLTLLFTLTFFVLSSSIKSDKKAILITTLVLLATLTRLSALFFALPIILYLFIPATKKVKLIMISLSLLVVAWMMFLAYPNFDVVRWNLLTHHTGQWGDALLYEKFLRIFTERIPLLLTVFIGYFLLAILLLVIGYKEIKQYFLLHKEIFITLIALMFFAVSHFASGGFHREYFTTFMFCLFPILGILYINIHDQKQGYRKIFLHVVLGVTLLLGIVIGRLAFVDTNTWSRPIAEVQEIAKVVTENSEEYERIFVLEALWIPVEANQYTMENTTMAQFSLIQDDTRSANLLNLVNGQIILEYFANQVPKIIILTELDWRNLEETDEYELIVQELNENYQIILEKERFGQTGGFLQLYLQKEEIQYQ